MKYALIVEWNYTDTLSTFFFDSRDVAIKERDFERDRGNYANLYVKLEEGDEESDVQRNGKDRKQ